jgi:hypothetical protein
VALAMNPPMQVSSSNSLISLAMTVLPQGWLRQNHNWEQELWFRDDMRTYTGDVDACTDTRPQAAGRPWRHSPRAGGANDLSGHDELRRAKDAAECIDGVEHTPRQSPRVRTARTKLIARKARGAIR